MSDTNIKTILECVEFDTLNDHELFCDWFCKDSSLANKQKVLLGKVRKLAKSPKINVETMSVHFKNNCHMCGKLYDDIRFTDIETNDIVYTVIPKSGFDSKYGQSEVWGIENDFKEPLVEGTWNDVLKYFGV